VRKHNITYNRIQTISVAWMLVFALVTPLVLIRQASAFAQMTERSIAISSSVAGATSTVYTVGFKPATSGTIQEIIIDFCNSATGPIIGTTCTAPTGFDLVKASTTIVNESGLNFGTGWAINSTLTTASKLVITDSLATTSVSAGTAVSFDIGTGAGANGVTNPTGTTGSFYARIMTYATTTAGDSYSSATTGSNNPPAATVDAGGIALSTVDQLTINARVQEVLVFCVGTTDAGISNDCSDISLNTVDLGIIDSSTVSISPIASANGGNGKNGLAMIRTNAVNGAQISYFAGPVTGDTGSLYLASLRVKNATCTGDGTYATGLQDDQCFNSAGLTQTIFSTTAPVKEGFGMTASSVDTTNGTTTNLVRDAQYDGDGTNNAGNGWAWSQGTTDVIASSMASTKKVLDDEMLVLRFAAVAAVTTPTGSYGVTSTYIATSTF